MYSRKDFLSDVLVVGVVGLLGVGTYGLFKSQVRNFWAAKSQGRRPAVPLLAEGTPVNLDWSVRTLDGREVAVSSLKGKVLFLNFWATWCGPCRLEMPSLEKLYQRFKDKDVVFLAISDEDSLVLKSFVQKRGTQIPIYTIDRMPPALRVTGLPTTYVLTRSGKVALSRAGAVDWNKKKVITLIETLLAK